MKGKSQKGITLVALIITIIVLLILAVVTISAINNAEIIQHAQNSVDEYGRGQDKENATLQNYMDVLNHHKPTGGSNPQVEEIVWALVDLGDEEYELCFIGNVSELDLSQDKEVKAYVATFNEDTEELKYNENSEVTTIKLTDAFIRCYEGKVQTMKIGNLNIECEIEISYLEFQTPNLIFADATTSINGKIFDGYDFIESIIIPSSVTSISGNPFVHCDGLTSITIKKPQGSLDLSNSGLTAEQIASVVWAPEPEQ